MNFGQRIPEPANAVSYLITIWMEDSIRVLGDYYERYAQEDAADAPFQEVGKFPVLDRWKELGYPPIGDLAARPPEVLEGLIRDWFDQELLDRILPGPDVGLPRFLVNSIDQVTIDNGSLRIEGKAYSHPGSPEQESDPAMGTT